MCKHSRTTDQLPETDRLPLYMERSVSTTSAQPGTKLFGRQGTLGVVYRFPQSPSASPRFRDRSLRRLVGPRRQLKDTPSLQPHGPMPQCCMLSDRPRTDSDILQPVRIMYPCKIASSGQPPFLWSRLVFCTTSCDRSHSGGLSAGLTRRQRDCWTLRKPPAHRTTLFSFP